VCAAQQPGEGGAVAGAAIEQADGGGLRLGLVNCSSARSAMICFSDDVFTNIRYFWRLS
jgi:hypothetical protein